MRILLEADVQRPNVDESGPSEKPHILGHFEIFPKEHIYLRRRLQVYFKICLDEIQFR